MKFLIYRASEKIASDFILDLPMQEQPTSRRQEPVVVRVAHVKVGVPVEEILKTVPILRTVELGLGWYGDVYRLKGTVWIRATTTQYLTGTERWVRVTRIRPLIASGMKLPVFQVESAIRLTDYL